MKLDILFSSQIIIKLDIRDIVFGSFEAFLSGFCASCASVCARYLSSLPSPLSNSKVSDITEEFFYYNSFSSISTLYTQWIIGVLIFIFLNILMWLVFTRALHDCRSVILAALINTSSNIVSSGLFGSYLFHETTGPLWSFGVALIVVGLSCILTSEVRD